VCVCVCVQMFGCVYETSCVSVWFGHGHMRWLLMIVPQCVSVRSCGCAYESGCVSVGFGHGHMR